MVLARRAGLVVLWKVKSTAGGKTVFLEVIGVKVSTKRLALCVVELPRSC